MASYYTWGKDADQHEPYTREQGASRGGKQECCSKKMMRGEAQGKQTMHPHRLDMARLAASVLCKGSPPTSVSNNRP